MTTVPTSSVTPELDDATRATWRKTFDSFDKDSSGTISRQELRNVLVALGQDHSDAHITALLTSIGLSKSDSTIDFDQFTRLVSVRSTLEIDRDELRQVFATCDLDYSGYVTAAELRHFFANLHIHMDDNKMAELIKIYDLDGNGQITIDEFEVIVSKLGFTIVGDQSPTTPSNITTNDEAEQKAESKTTVADGPEEPPIKLDDIKDPGVRSAMALFDRKSTGHISLSDLRHAADMLNKYPPDAKQSDPSLHWAPNRELLGLGAYVEKVNHIALIVSDVGRSTRFYVNVMGFQQIRRPNFDRHGAWFTMGNVELHLIKGTPVVHSGADLIVGHISIETTEIDKVPGTLRRLGVPFRQNVSVPKGEDAGKGTNTSSTSAKIVRQYFIRDPDGYYIEICNCDVLTKYCLGDKKDLPGYDEGVKPLSLENAIVTVNLMQKWSEAGREQFAETMEMVDKVKTTDGSIAAVAQILGCKKADRVDENLLKNLVVRTSVYGDVCQNETPDELEEILQASGNDSYMANRIMALRQEFRGYSKMQPPAFYEQGEKVKPPSITHLQ